MKKKCIIRKVQITTEEKNAIEALNYEVFSRQNIMKYIKRNNIFIEEDTLAKYKSEIVSFYIQLQLLLESTAKKYFGDAQVERVIHKADFDANTLFFREFQK